MLGHGEWATHDNELDTRGRCSFISFIISAFTNPELYFQSVIRGKHKLNSTVFNQQIRISPAGQLNDHTLLAKMCFIYVELTDECQDRQLAGASFAYCTI